MSCCRQNDSQQLINAALPSPYTTRIQETICEPPPKARTDLRQEFGATEVVSEHGAAAERVRELTGGDGTGTVLDCVGTMEVLQTAFRAVGDGGVAQYKECLSLPAPAWCLLRLVPAACHL